MAPSAASAPQRPPRLSPARRDAIRQRLLAWWDAGHRDLPWRFPQHGADPYRVWLAEVLLQQTQVAVVVPRYQALVRRFPTLEALAAADDEELLRLWSGLGYYARARRLLAAAREAVARHGGLPASLEALRALPGFGAYTAGAVASIAFAIPAPAVDGNVARVLSRLFALEGRPEAPATGRALAALAARLVPADRPGDFNQALMELGATVCRTPSPRCAACPLAAQCRARAAGRERELPPPRRRAAPRRAELACAVVARGREVLLVRRPPGGLFGGLWALPAAEVEEGGEARAALRAAVARVLSRRAAVGAELAGVERLLTHRRLRLTAYACRLDAPPGIDGRSVRWARPEAAGALGVSTAMARLLDAVAASGTFAANPLTGRGVTV